MLASLVLYPFSLLTAVAVSDKSYGVPDLLMPQLQLHINLRIPDYCYVKVCKLSKALTAAFDFLVSKDVPFRLFLQFHDIKTDLGSLQTTSSCPE